MAGQSGAGLEIYNEKRDFSQTAEPRGRKARKAGRSFVIQKHAATRLHYDLRLEMDGVLKSWAVTRGPSLVAGEKRLAVHVEDHPLDYGTFEGTIPKGNYGAGAVIVWDRGEWTPVDGDYAKGKLEFELKGEKLSGRWHLVRMRGKRGERRENWLLIKSDDAAARPDDAPDILTERPESVQTGRTVEEVAQGAEEKPRPAKPKPARRSRAKDPDAPTARAKKSPMPDFIEPALATLKPAPPAGPKWLHEVKFDGYRLQARLEGQEVRLLTRSGLDWTHRFGAEITDALRALPAETAIMDGELVVESGAGASDFSALQADLSDGRNDRFVLYLFDLMYLDGYDLREAPLIERKEVLEKLVGAEPGRIRFSSHFGESGSMVLRHACRLSLEGIVSKEADAPYRSGRGKGWIKSKCSARQEFVVAGYVPSTTSDRLVGSLVLGVHEGDTLTYVGRVGTGFSQKMASELRERLDGMRIDKSPFAGRLTADESRGVRFVRPDLVAEVEFRAWTADGHLRHASFRGLREDKPAADVVRESGPAKEAPKAPRRRVTLTHPDRIYWPDEGITKEGLADYYAEVWPKIAPFIVGRPLALLRCPGGINGQKFFQKHAWKGIAKQIGLVKDPAEPAEEAMIAINDMDGLMALVQSATLEIHPWGSTVADWDRPDTITMDLDPGEGVPWEAVIAGAVEVRQRLADAGLESFVKTSGGKGLHVVAPLTPRADWPAVKAFTKGLADAMAADAPGDYVSTITKSKRKGRILIDYLRNQRGMTAVAAYSTRARPGAAVSMPVAWEELDQFGPDYFTVVNTPNRLAALARDPWEDFRAAARPLEANPSSRGRKG